MLLGETATSWIKERITLREAAAQCLHEKSFAHAETETAARGEKG